MANTTKISCSSHFRSISLPSRSHPTTHQVEEELRKLKTWETSAAQNGESISNGLLGLVELYDSMNELLNLPQTIQALSKHQNEKWVDGLLEGQVKLLDICGITIDVVSRVKEHFRDIQSSLRRRKSDLSNETSITKYISFRKKMKKDAKRLITSLKQMDQAIEASILDVDQHVSSLVKVMKEVNAMSISIFQCVIVFLSASKTRRSKWSISRLMHNGTIECENQKDIKNELESIDNALCRPKTNESSEAEKILFLKNRLENTEAGFEGIEIGLESIFRCFLKSRTSLLNIVSC